jgi:hypothetical protein
MNYTQSSFSSDNKKSLFNSYLVDSLKLIILFLLVIIAGAIIS